MNKKDWDEVKRTLDVGTLLSGTITRHEPYGVFVDIGYKYDGLIQITDFKQEGVMTPEKYPPIGEKIQATVLGFKEHGCQIWLKFESSNANPHHSKLNNNSE